MSNLKKLSVAFTLAAATVMTGCATYSPPYQSMTPDARKVQLDKDARYIKDMVAQFEKTGAIPVNQRACELAKQGSGQAQRVGTVGGAAGGAIAGRSLGGGLGAVIGAVGGAIGGGILGKEHDQKAADQNFLDCQVLQAINNKKLGAKYKPHDMPMNPGGVN